MNNTGDTPDSRKNIAHGGGVVYSGTFSAPIATTTGREGSAANVTVDTQDQLIQALRGQLSEARRLLTENHDPRIMTDREDAIAQIESLDRELASRRQDRDTGKLRQRVKEIAGALAPVMEIIGGTAAFVDIINNLKSII